MYIPKTMEGAELDVVKKFIAWVAWPPDATPCAKHHRRKARSSPRPCKLPSSSVPPVATDTPALP